MPEFFPIVDENGSLIGKESRSVCHNGSSMLLHPVIHLHIFNTAGELYLQKRSMFKDIQPGKWDTAVGGHVDYGETIENALFREASEELGIKDFNPVFAFRYVFCSPVERELVHTFRTIYDNEIFPDASELDGGKFWTIQNIEENTGKEIFTPNFESEFQKLMEHLKM